MPVVEVDEDQMLECFLYEGLASGLHLILTLPLFLISQAFILNYEPHVCDQIQNVLIQRVLAELVAKLPIQGYRKRTQFRKLFEFFHIRVFNCILFFIFLDYFKDSLVC